MQEMQQTSRSQKLRVLIIEDDRDLNNLLKFTLESSQDYEVLSHFDGQNVIELMTDWRPQIVLLDVMLPYREGTEILRDMRKRKELSSVPVILLTAKSQEADKIEGFESGADDYITKPFSPRELLLRVHALLRRSGASFEPTLPVTSKSETPNESQLPTETASTPEKSITVGSLCIFPEQFKVLVQGETVALTATEYQLLLFLAERAGRLQSRDALLQKVWGYEGQLNTRTVDTHIKRLRQKLGDAGALIETVHGFGYQLIDQQRNSKSP